MQEARHAGGSAHDQHALALAMNAFDVTMRKKLIVLLQSTPQFAETMYGCVVACVDGCMAAWLHAAPAVLSPVR